MCHKSRERLEKGEKKKKKQLEGVEYELMYC